MSHLPCQAGRAFLSSDGRGNSGKEGFLDSLLVRGLHVEPPPAVHLDKTARKSDS